ncbi:MAG TPA: hypothetical protein VKF62_03925 [Planctomycetota bacterium]|nr:hypothetical protein [Planctomycetota bacterium]
MASKKILLEVLSTDRNRVAPPPPRPKKEKEERRRERRASRPFPLPHPSAPTLVLALGCVVAIVAAYGVGFWRGRNAASTPPDLSTSVRAPDLLDKVPDESPPPKPVAGEARPAEPRKASYGIQLVSYEPGERNAERARGVKKELETLGLPNVMAWESTKPPLSIFITVGSFASEDDAALTTLLGRVKGMSFGKEKAPFSGATIRTLPVP